MDSIQDARNAVDLNKESFLAREALGKALYSAGCFEHALVQFYKANRSVLLFVINKCKNFFRIRQSSTYEEWITRCEETIKSYLAATKIEGMVVQKLLETNESSKGVLLHENTSTANQDRTNTKNSSAKKPEIKLEKGNKTTGLIMGKLHEDMMFLEKLAYHPALTNDLLGKKFKKKDKKGNLVENRNICGTAKDGLNFLQVRKDFWETSEPSGATIQNRKYTKSNKNKE